MQSAYSQRLLGVERFVTRASFLDTGRASQGILHADRVVENLDRLINREALERFDGLEIFCLLCSAYLHDVGMLVTDKGRPMGGSDRIQKMHSLKSAEIISQEYKHLGLDPVEAYIVGMICRAHSSDYDLSSIPSMVPVGRHEVRLRFLASLLRLADVLDMDFRRLPVGRDKKNQDYWNVHQAIIGWNLDPETNAIILTLTDFPKSIPEDSIRVLTNSLGKVLRSTSKTLTENGIPPKNIAYRILKYPKE
jgi:hypothetical protein